MPWIKRIPEYCTGVIWSLVEPSVRTHNCYVNKPFPNNILPLTLPSIQIWMNGSGSSASRTSRARTVLPRRLRRGPRYVRQDIQVTLAPSVSRRVIPFAATVLRSGTPRRYRSRVPSLNDSTPSI